MAVSDFLSHHRDSSILCRAPMLPRMKGKMRMCSFFLDFYGTCVYTH